MSSVIPGIIQGQVRTLYNEIARFGALLDDALVRAEPGPDLSGALIGHARSESRRSRDHAARLDEGLAACEQKDGVRSDAAASEESVLVLGAKAESVNRILTSAMRVFDEDTLKRLYADAAKPCEGDGAPVDAATRKRAMQHMFQTRLHDLAP